MDVGSIVPLFALIATTALVALAIGPAFFTRPLSGLLLLSRP